MSGIRVTVVGLEALSAQMRQLSDAVAAEALENAALAGGLPILNAAKEKARKRTRTLARSLSEEVAESDRDHAIVEIGTDLEYAAVHEFGGVISPAHGRFLAVPLTDEARQFTGPTLFPGELHAVFSGEEGVLVDDGGTAQYALKTFVTVTAQPYLRPAMDEQETAAVEAMEDALNRLLDEIAPD